MIVNSIMYYSLLFILLRCFSILVCISIGSRFLSTPTQHQIILAPFNYTCPVQSYYVSTILFILFSMAPNIVLLHETRNHTKSILVFNCSTCSSPKVNQSSCQMQTTHVKIYTIESNLNLISILFLLLKSLINKHQIKMSNCINNTMYQKDVELIFD